MRLQLNYGAGVPRTNLVTSALQIDSDLGGVGEDAPPPPPQSIPPPTAIPHGIGLQDVLDSSPQQYIISGSAVVSNAYASKTDPSAIQTALNRYGRGQITYFGDSSNTFQPDLSSARQNETTRWGTSLDSLPFASMGGADYNHNMIEDPNDEDEGHVNLPNLPMPSRQFVPSRDTVGEPAGGGLEGLNSFGVAQSPSRDFAAQESVPLPPFPNADEPVVPSKHADQLALTNAPVDWTVFPSSRIVSSLLHARGAMLPAHKMLFEYHMAESFLECLELLQEGSYFIYYPSKSAAPKERYFRVEMGDDGRGRLIPFLNWYVHKDAVGLTDRVPLSNLVGVTPNHRSSVFRVHMVNAHTIIGCFSGDSRLRLPASGCFTLWFWDPYYSVPRSVDLLTTNPLTHKLWVMAMRGALSVNSVTIGARKSDLAAQLAEVQQMIDAEENQHHSQ